MRGLHTVLPTYASDYAGACSALYELGGLVVVYGASGCAGNVMAYDEPRAWNLPSRLYTSDMTDVDALLGRDAAVVNMAENTFRTVSGEFVALVGTPNTMVVGTDYDAVAKELGRRCGVPAIWVDTTGARTYEVGCAEALAALARGVVFSGAAVRPGVVEEKVPGRTLNLLGASSLDFGQGKPVEVACGLLEAAGWRVSSCWAMGSTIVDLRRGLDADCNVVLSVSGLKLARWMQRRYDIPYVWARLTGEVASARFLTELENVAAGGAVKEGSVCGKEPRGHRDGRALVVADQVVACSIRAALEEDAGFDEVSVASLFTVDREGMRPGDTSTLDEADVCDMIRNGGYDVVIGDGVLAECAGPDTRCRFVNIAHPAVSSRLLGEEGACPFGSELLEALK